MTRLVTGAGNSADTVTTARFTRSASRAGLAFAVLWIAGIGLATNSAAHYNKHDSVAVYTAKTFAVFHSGSQREQTVLGACLLVVAALALVWFAAGQRTTMRQTEQPNGPGDLTLASASVAAALLIVGALTLATIPISIIGSSEPTPLSPDTIRLTYDLSGLLIQIGFGFSMAAVIATLVISDRHRNRLPRWLKYTSILAILGGLLGIAFYPFLLTMAWIAAASIHDLRTNQRSLTLPRKSHVID